MPDLIFKCYFMQNGYTAPASSDFKGVVTQESIFGSSKSKRSFFEYTHRSNAIEKETKQEDESFLGYTSRKSATENSTKDESKYFTMTNSGKLYTKEDYEQWAEENKKYFSNKGDLIWFIDFSFRSGEVLKEYNIKSQSDMAKLTQIAMTKALRKLKLDDSNVVWWQDYHTNTKHDHLHITFLEKEKTRTRGKFTQKQLESFKATFYNEFGARKQYYDKFQETVQQAVKNISQTRKDVVQKTKEINFAEVKEIIALYEVLPKEGRLQYGSSHMIPYRKQLDSIVNMLLTCEPLKTEYEQFKDYTKQFSNNLNEIGNEEVSHIFANEDLKLRKQIANVVLNGFKTFSDSGVTILDLQTSQSVQTSQSPIIENASNTYNRRKRYIPLTKKSYRLFKNTRLYISSQSLRAMNEHERELQRELNEYLRQKQEYETEY